MAFYKGDTVYSVLRGEGTVMRVLTNDEGMLITDYPVSVRFINGDVGFFTIKGKNRYTDLYPELYNKETVPYEKRSQSQNNKENLKQYR